MKAYGTKLALSFKVTPAMGSGKVSLASVPKKGKKKITLGTKTFKLGSSGKVSLVFKPARKSRKAARKLKTLTVRATITIGGQTFTPTFKLIVSKQT